MNESATEALRRMLDERGVEYEVEDYPARKYTYGGDSRFRFDEDENGDTELHVICFTPEQAIAATLGRPTWRNSHDQQRYDQWYDLLFHGEPSSFKELIEDVIWTTETVDLGPNGNECQGVDEGEVNTERLIEEWVKRAETLGNEINGDTSDGYHTFNELYHHRAVLFSVIVRDHRELAWKARKHHDGTMYDGMFIVGIDTPWGQASYHYDIDPYWNMFNCEEWEFAPEWDGHTPDDAIERIGKLVTLGGRKLSSEQIRDAIFNNSIYAGYDSSRYYINGIGMDTRHIASKLNATLKSGT